LPEPGRADIASADLTPATGARTTRLRRPRRHSKKPLDKLGTSLAEALAKADQRRSSACRMIAHRPKPALRFLCTPDAAASTASRPASVTIASRPLMGRDNDRIRVIWVNRETNYFCERDSTAFFGDCPSGKSLSMKNQLGVNNAIGKYDLNRREALTP
jgi:hypothetical protein